MSQRVRIPDGAMEEVAHLSNYLLATRNGPSDADFRTRVRLGCSAT
jgi:hypothetical protein